MEMLLQKNLGKLLHIRVECGSYLPDWRTNINYRKTVSAKKELGGGVLLELSHELDYIRHFFGPFKNVKSYLYNSGSLGLNVEESADLIFETISGVPAIVHLDFNSRSPRRYCIAQFSDGEMSWNINENFVNWSPSNGIEVRKTFDDHPDDMYRNQLIHFLDCIENRKNPLASIDDGIKVLKMIEAIHDSHTNGKTISFT